MCPPFSVYNEDTHECDCEEDEHLSMYGCIADVEEDCWSQGQSIFDEDYGTCVSIFNCPDDDEYFAATCRACMTIDLNGRSISQSYIDASQEARCSVCKEGYFMVGPQCVAEQESFECPVITDDSAELPDALVGCLMCLDTSLRYGDDLTTYDPTTANLADLICSGECHDGWHYNELLGHCEREDHDNEITIYTPCPEAPEAIDNGDGTFTTPEGDQFEEHLYGCAVCVQKPTIGEMKFCAHCKPGYLNFLGGCYEISQGVHTPNDQMCRNCNECLRFDRFLDDGSHYFCNECFDGYYKSEEDEAECELPEFTHCNYEESTETYTPGMFVGM